MHKSNLYGMDYLQQPQKSKLYCTPIEFFKFLPDEFHHVCKKHDEAYGPNGSFLSRKKSDIVLGADIFKLYKSYWYAPFMAPLFSIGTLVFGEFYYRLKKD